MRTSTWLLVGWVGILPLRASGAIFEANFNEIAPGLALTQPTTDPLPLRRPTNVVLDFPNSGDTIEIVPQSGNLTDQPVLLEARPGGISFGGFLNPAVYTSGDFSVSWDSLLLARPADEFPQPFQGVQIVTRTGDPARPAELMLHERWQLRYAPDGRFEIGDAFGVRAVGNYNVGQADHFALTFSLDTGDWQLAVNGNDLLDGFLLQPFEFGGTVFSTNGRFGMADPPGLVLDNLRIEALDGVLGDYNGNGTVEQGDLDLVLLNWGMNTPPIPSGWIQGQPTGQVDQSELDQVLLNWGTTTSFSTPEPPAKWLALLLLAVAAVSRFANKGSRITTSRMSQEPA